MINVIKKKISIDESLRKKLEIICGFCNVKPKFKCGSIRKLDKTNISYIEPHKLIIDNMLFLIFNYSNDVYINNLTKKIKLTELEDYIKTHKN